MCGMSNAPGMKVALESGVLNIYVRVLVLGGRLVGRWGVVSDLQIDYQNTLSKMHRKAV